VRWPSSFGDTSAAGAILTNVMFRVIHIVLLGACVWVAFDQKFSPRKLGLGFPFLTLYYLGALAIGYFAGYVLLVFGETKGKSWRRRSPGTVLLDRLAITALWLAAIAVPAGLIYKNLPVIRANSGRALHGLAEASAKSIPEKASLVLSDDARSLLLLQGYLAQTKPGHDHVFIHTRSLSIPEYHRQLLKKYPKRWPNILDNDVIGARIDDATILGLVSSMSQQGDVYYLHPSFGFYFEEFYPQPQGLVFQLRRFEKDTLIPPALSRSEMEANEKFWAEWENKIKELPKQARHESLEAVYTSVYYARALNHWGVELQKQKRLDDAAKFFKSAADLNTNSVPALVNLEFNRTLRTGESSTNAISKIMSDKYALYPNLEAVLISNGPVDHPEFCHRLGQLLIQQNLLRQAALQFHRAFSLEPTNMLARVALASVYLQRQSPDRALEEAEKIKAGGNLDSNTELELLRLKAAAYFAKTNHSAAEQLLVQAQSKFPDHPSVLETLVMLYGQIGRTDEALNVIAKLLKVSPDNPKALINQATLYFNTNKIDLAIQSLDRVLQKDPKNLQALLYKVFMFTETKDYDKAQAAVEKILVLDPDNTEALLYQGGIFIETKKYEEALKPLDRLLKLQPVSIHGLRNRAIAHLRRGELDLASRDYERLREQAPTFHIPYFGLAEIAYQRKDKAAAIKNYELYLKYVPSEAALEDEKKIVNERLRELKAGGG
jgi:tetratricopeptide (TPR) repeat protein